MDIFSVLCLIWIINSFFWSLEKWACLSRPFGRPVVYMQSSTPAIVDDVFNFLMTLQSEEGSNFAEKLNDVVLLNTRTIWCFLILTLWHIFASCNDMPTLFCIVFSPLVVAMLFSQGYFTREMKSKCLAVLLMVANLSFYS